VRRKFVDIFRSQGSPIAEEAIGRIAQLYAVEKEARGSPPDRRAELRQAHAAPIFDDLERWLAMQLTTISGKSPLAAAIRYALTRMDRLRPYLDHGILELDNNAAERGMRAIALGRKNYLFVGSEAGGKAAAIAYLESLRLEMAPKGIKVVTIAPGYIDTDMVRAVPPEVLSKIVEKIPVKRLGKAEEIIKSIENKRKILAMPLPYWFIRLSQGILPLPIFDWVMDHVFGVYDTMKYFKGRR
jgi:hypothetical protein